MFERLALKISKAANLVRNRRYASILARGVAAAVEHEPFLRSIKLASIIDVGANVGQFSAVALETHPEAVLHAFEPLPDAQRRYQRLFGGRPNMHLYPFAVGSVSGTACFFLSQRSDNSSLLPITDAQNEMFPGTGAAGTIDVEVVRIDDVLADEALPRPLLVKLDIQGGELDALKGMPEILRQTDFIYLEVSFLELYAGQPLMDEIWRWLSAQGFRLEGIFNLQKSAKGMPVQADALFSSAPKASV